MNARDRLGACVVHESDEDQAEFEWRLDAFRAEVLTEAAEEVVASCPDHGPRDEAWMNCHCDVADELRRMAAAGPVPASGAVEDRTEYIVGCLREAGAMCEDDARSFLAEHDAEVRAQARGCDRCRRPFDPPGNASDGRDRYGETRFCRRCVDQCHASTGAFHACGACSHRAFHACDVCSTRFVRSAERGAES